MASAASCCSTGPHAKAVRVCDPCHRRKVSCDLLRPTCSACAKYSKNKPDHVCTYGPGAALPGQPKVRRDPSARGSDGSEEDSLMPAKTRSKTREAQQGHADMEGQKRGETEADSSEVEESSSSMEDTPNDCANRPIPARLSLPTSFPTFPSTLPPLPSLPRGDSPVPSPVTPQTPYFTSVFSPLPSPELVASSAPALSPRPSSSGERGAARRSSFPDHEVLFARDFLAEAQRGLARLSVSPPMTARREGDFGQAGRPFEWEEQFDDVFAWG
ncbi:hypothetical protein JCM6882_002836 [Rhodosporidiobolus microsporus]